MVIIIIIMVIMIIIIIHNCDFCSFRWREMDPETMCATVNDSERMQVKCDEFGDHLLKFLVKKEEKELLRDVLVRKSTDVFISFLCV